MAYGMAGMPGNRYMAGLPRGMGGFPAVGGGLGGLPVRRTNAFTRVSDVFNASLYTGNGATQTITNGIDLAGKGGLVWLKNRALASDHRLLDTTRGAGKVVYSSTTAAETTEATTLTAFNSNGFTLGGYLGTSNFASWTFRKAAKFFDCGTYTGNGTAGRQIPHSLGVAPGMILFKRTDSPLAWYVYHVATGTANYLTLNGTAAAAAFSIVTAADASTFTLPNDGSVNGSGASYVYYAFAHDASSSGVIQCLSFTTDGSGNASITHGWSSGVQFAMLKASSTTGDWEMLDTARTPAWTSNEARLRANLSDAEDSVSRIAAADGVLNVSGLSVSSTYVCMLIKAP